MSMNIYSLSGKKVKLYTLASGHDWQKEIIEKHLVLWKIYTVDYTVVHNSSTEVYLKEVPGISFNSVFFEDVKKNNSNMTTENTRTIFFYNCR